MKCLMDIKNIMSNKISNKYIYIVYIGFIRLFLLFIILYLAIHYLTL